MPPRSPDPDPIYSKEEVVIRADAYRHIFETIPSHRDWFSWDMLQRVVVEMVEAELSVEYFTEKIRADVINNLWMGKPLEKFSIRLDRARSRLMLDGSKMAKALGVRKSGPATEKDKKRSMIQSYSNAYHGTDPDLEP